jgi:uncharacterized protein YlxW (UPF0749 family)
MATPTLRRAIWSVLLIGAGIALGLSITSQLKIRLVPERIAPSQPLVAVAQSIHQVTEEIAADRAAIEKLQATFAGEQAALANGQSTAELATQLADDRIALGLTEQTGRGLIITLADSVRAKGSFGVAEASDIRDIVNVLWRYGATAIAVNGERIAATTSIDAVAETTLINGVRTTQPYTITALYPKGVASQALENAGVLRTVQARVELEGLRFAIRPQAAVVVPAYRGSFAHEYAVIKEQP